MMVKDFMKNQQQERMNDLENFFTRERRSVTMGDKRKNSPRSRGFYGLMDASKPINDLELLEFIKSSGKIVLDPDTLDKTPVQEKR